jgi:hypothetical protein
VVTPLAARAISRPVWERWQARPFAGQVLGVFERSCHLGPPGGDIVALVLPELGEGPLNVVVEGEPGLFATVEPGISVYRSGNRLQAGDLDVDLDGATIWEPRPAWERLRAHGQAIAEHLPLVQALALRQAPKGSLLELLAAPLAGPLATLAASPADESALREGAAHLAGLGGGLTPAGDDFLVGAMLWVWLTRPAPQPLCQTLLEAAAPRTTALSAAFLRAAAHGECGASWHALLAVLAEGNDADLPQAVRAVLDHGHTSGADTLAGFLWMGSRP